MQKHEQYYPHLLEYLELQKFFKEHPEVIPNFAKIMVQLAPNDGEGLRPGQVVGLTGQSYTEPLFVAIAEEVFKAGGKILPQFTTNQTLTTSLAHRLFKYGNEEQLKFFPEQFWQSQTDAIDVFMLIQSMSEVSAVKDEAMQKNMLIHRDAAMVKLGQMRQKKVQAGTLSTVGCVFGTGAMAAEVGMTLPEYWHQLCLAYYLYDADPVGRWRKTKAELQRVIATLNEMKIKELRYTGKDIDLIVPIGSDRIWMEGVGKNVPSNESYTSPDARGITGWVRFNQPVYYQNQKIAGVYFKVENGFITEADATEGKELLLKLLEVPGARRFGECAIVDERHSEITRPMAMTMFDENMKGNIHFAIGNSFFKDACNAPHCENFTDAEWEERGYNKSTLHIDFVSTEPRNIHALLDDGTLPLIYKGNRYTFLQ